MAIALVAARIGDPMYLALDMEQRAVALWAALDRGLTATAGLVGCVPPSAASAIDNHYRFPFKAHRDDFEDIPTVEVVIDVLATLLTGCCMN
jgi:hypothetical protein